LYGFVRVSMIFTGFYDLYGFLNPSFLPLNLSALFQTIIHVGYVIFDRGLILTYRRRCSFDTVDA
jgi:hypothetical protein